MSKNLYIGIYAASLGLCLLTLIVSGAWFVLSVAQKNNEAADAATAYAARIGIYAVLQFAVIHAVFNFVLLYRMWRAIQDGQTSVTVHRAVGFLFIPLFNIYWIFRVWNDYPVEYNRYVDRYDLPVAPLGEKVFAAYPVASLLAAVFIAPLVWLPIVFVRVISNSYDAVNLLNEAVRERRRQSAAIRTPNFSGERAAESRI